MPELRVTRDGGVARLTLDRSPLNVLTPALIDALGAAFRDLAVDPTLRVVVLAGAGRAFSAGVDVAAMRDLDTAGARALIGRLRATVRAIEEVLRRNDVKYELRSSSKEDLTYSALLPLNKRTDRVTNALLVLGNKDEMSVEWSDRKQDAF